MVMPGHKISLVISILAVLGTRVGLNKNCLKLFFKLSKIRKHLVRDMLIYNEN